MFIKNLDFASHSTNYARIAKLCGIAIMQCQLWNNGFKALNFEGLKSSFYNDDVET
jgi:hypothetical protein